MKRFFKSITFIAMIMVLSSCASIVSRSYWPLTVKSEPMGAKVQITNSHGISVYKGQTPSTVFLKSGAGFFTAESYLVKLSLDGYAEKTIPVSCSLNGWYFGNIIFGGLIGMLIVDPVTGAMYRLDTQFINETLKSQATGDKGTTLKIVSINDLSQDMRTHLVSIK